MEFFAINVCEYVCIYMYVLQCRYQTAVQISLTYLCCVYQYTYYIIYLYIGRINRWSKFWTFAQTQYYIYTITIFSNQIQSNFHWLVRNYISQRFRPEVESLRLQLKLKFTIL